MSNVYLEILKFKMYPNKKQKYILDDEIHFYSRYKNALFNEISKKQSESLFKFNKEDYELIIDNFYKNVRKSKFNFNKYFYYDHFLYAKENVLKSLTYERKQNIKTYPIDRTTIKIKNSSICILYNSLNIKGEMIKIRPKIEILTDIDFINITRNNGDYFLTVALKRNITPLPKTHLACGIDVGFDKYLTIYSSDDETYKIEFKNDKLDKLISKASFYKKVLINIEEKNIHYINSHNYKKTLIKLEKTYQKISNIRGTFFNKTVLEIVRKFDVITIESLPIESLYKVRSSKLHLQKNSFGTFFKILEEKAKKFGKYLIKADRFFMSSQICSECGLIHNEMKDYHLREFKCECGYCCDRDTNAARNLMYYGLKKIRVDNLTLLKKCNYSYKRKETL